MTFQGMGRGLGQSNTPIGTVDYPTFFAALAAHSTTANDAVALAHLPPGPNSPVNNDPNVRLSAANIKALGIQGFNLPQTDGTISLNTSIMNLSRSLIDQSKFDLSSVVRHEVDEVPGLGSTLGTPAASPRRSARRTSG